MCFNAALSGALARSAFALLPLQLSPGLPVAAVGRWARCVFSVTHHFLQPPGKPVCGEKALEAHTPFVVCAARPGGLYAAAFGCTWLRPPAGTAFWLFSFFSEVTQKNPASSCTVCCLVCNSVQVCSCTACSSELPHLLPPCGARCVTVPMNLVLA